MSAFKKSRVYIEAIKFNEFKEIKFRPDGYPKFALDLLKYVTLVDIEELYRLRRIEKKRQEIAAAGLDVRIHFNI